MSKRTSAIAERERCFVSQVQVEIETVVVGGGPVASMLVLRPKEDERHSVQLPIRIGTTEASSIGMGIDHRESDRPMTHDLLLSMIAGLGGSVTHVVIDRVEGTLFYAHVSIARPDGRKLMIDARPSDAVALAVRAKVPIYVESTVLDTASSPDFRAAKRDGQELEMASFHEFVENLSPEDFS